MGVINIGVKDFIKGISTAKFIPDGGFSPQSKGIRPVIGSYSTTSPRKTELLNIGTGLLRPRPPVIDDAISANIDYQIINMVNVSFAGSEKLVAVAPTGTTNAEFYFWNRSESTDATHNHTTTNGAKFDRLAHTQMAIYRDRIYCSCDDDVVQLTPDGTTMDDTWGSDEAISSGIIGAGEKLTTAPRPLLVYQGDLYIGNGNKLLYYDGTSIGEVDLTFAPDDIIVALDVIPSTGDMIISTTVGKDYAAEFNGTNRIYLWNGGSKTFEKEVQVEDMVTSFYNLGGITYIFYGTSFGYWNGSGITHLRQLNISRSDQELIYKGRATDLNGTLYILENRQDGSTTTSILAYGPIFSGQKNVFYYPFTQNCASSDCILNVGAIKEGAATLFTERIAMPYSFSSSYYLSIFNPYDTDYSAGVDLYTNLYELPANSRIDRIDVVFETLTSGDSATVKIVTDTGTIETVGTISFASDGAVKKKSFQKIDTITSNIQGLISWATGGFGISRIDIYYSPVEEEL